MKKATPEITKMLNEIKTLARQHWGDKKVVGFDRWRAVHSFVTGKKVDDGLPDKMTIEEHDAYLEKLYELGRSDSDDDYIERYDQERDWDEQLCHLIDKN